jgi:tripartite-type tricarboxylate transporter receptor subunit TctC
MNVPASFVRLTLALCALATAAHADDIDNFYAGRQITIIVGSSSGGGYDLSARLLARHLGEHIPRHPGVIVRNMPGAGGLAAANYIANKAPRDGTEIAALARTLPVLPLFGAAEAQFDPLKLNWLGSSVNVVGTAVAWYTAPVKTFDDLLTHELIIGAAGAGSQATIYPTALNSILGTKFKIISGYPGSAEILLAMQRGEVEGFGSWSWSGIDKSGFLRDRKINVLVQLGMKKQPDHPDVPLVLDLAKTSDDRAVLELIFAPQTFARPLALPPDMPHQRVEMLRQAFDATMRDPNLIADAEKEKLETELVTGKEIDALLAKLYASPRRLIDRAKAALGGSIKAE